MATRKRKNVGNVLIAPQAVINTYGREIVAIVRQMIKDYKQLLTVYKDKASQMAMDASENAWLTTDVEKRLRALGDKYYKLFQDFAKKKSTAMVQKVLKLSDMQVKSALKDYLAESQWTLIGEKIPVQMRQAMVAHVAENVALIKSIATQYHERIEGSLYRAISGDGSLKQLREDFMKYGNMSQRRAKLIASDQTHKAFTTLAARRMASVGVTRFQWVHSHAVEKPRPLHIRKWDGVSGLKDGKPNGLDGFIFTLDNPPVIDEKTDERGLPGRLPFCRCSMRPVFGEDD